LLLLSSEEQQSGPAASADVTLNKRDMALRLRISLPTLTAWIDRWPDFPIAQRGTNGASYRFVPEEVFQFLAERREEELRERSGRDEQLMALQLTFDALLPAQPVEQRRTISTKEEIELWKLRDLKRREAERCGTLVIAAEVQDMFASALARLQRDQAVFIRKLGRQEGWPESQMRAVEAQFAEVQRAAVRDALAILNTDPTVDERQLNLT